MKTLIAILSVLVALATAQDCHKNAELARTGVIDLSSETLCSDLCTGALVAFEDCFGATHCAVKGKECILKRSSDYGKHFNPFLKR